MRKLLSIFCLAILCCTSFAQQKVYTLADWNIKDWDSSNGELQLDVNEYKLDFNHPLPFLARHHEVDHSGNGINDQRKQ